MHTAWQWKKIKLKLTLLWLSWLYIVLERDRLEIRMLNSTSDSPKLCDRFDNSETKTRNRETCLDAGFTVSSVVYRAVSIDHRYKHFSIVFAKLGDWLDILKLYSVVRSEFLVDHALSKQYSFVSTSKNSKSHSMAGAIQVEANLQEQLSNYFKFWLWKYRPSSLSTTFAMVAFHRK